MANIATLLARILTTRYGRDMRQDLHDSIEAVNNDTENALGKKLTFTNNTRKLKLLANDDTVLSEVVIPGGGSGGGSVDSVNGLFPDENGNVEVNLDDINDVDITSAADGQTLVYDATSGKWLNGSGGGGTTDYTDLTNKPSINGVTLSGNKTSADLGISGGGSNENLLNNGWFTVNSKKLGGLSLTTSEQILVDDWIAYRSSGGSSYVDIRSTGLAIFPSLADDYTVVRQYLDKSVIGQTLTLSVNVYEDGIHSWTFTPTSASEYYYSSIWTYSSCTVQFMFNNNEVSLLLKKTVNEDRYITLRAVKMEIGNGSTLATDYLPNYDIESIKCNGVMRSNRNLLDNPWFTVNQKGFTSGSIATIGESVPFIDRWKGNYQTSATSTISLSNNQLTLTIPSGVGCGISQGSEAMQTMTSGTATVSIMFADGTIISKDITLSATPTVYQLGTYNGLSIDYRHYTTLNAFLFVFNNTTDSQKVVTIKAVKFELGTESTLALDVEPNYTEELLKCQRYYYPLSGKEFMGFKSSNYEVKVPLPTEMRTTPTISLTGTSIGLTGSSQQGGSISSATVSVSGNEALVNVGLTMAGGGSDYNVCSTFEIFNLVGYLSAEL